MDDLEDSEVEGIQAATTPQRLHKRLRKSLGSSHAVQEPSSEDTEETASHGGNATSGSEQAGPSHSTRRRKRSTRAAAAVARRRLSDAAAEMQADSGAEQGAHSDAAADSFIVSSEDTDEESADEDSPDELSDARPPAKRSRPAARCSERVPTPDEESAEESPEDWPDATPPAKVTSAAAARGSKQVPVSDEESSGEQSSDEGPGAMPPARRSRAAGRGSKRVPAADERTAEESSPDEWPDASPLPASAPRAAAHGSRRPLTADSAPNNRRHCSHAAAADADGSQSDDAGPSRPQVATPGTRARSRRSSGSHAGASQVAAAGEAFRRRLAARKLPPDEAVVAAARRQSGQGLARSASQPDSGDGMSEERSPPIADFIVEDEEEAVDADGSGHGPRPHFHFTDDDGLSDVAEAQRPHRKRKKRRRGAEAGAAAGKLPAAAQSPATQQDGGPGPSGAAQAAGSSQEAGAAPQHRPIVLSSSEDEKPPPAHSPQQRQRQHITRHFAHDLDSACPDAAGPSAAAGQFEDSPEAGAADAAADAGAAAGSAQKRRRLSKVESEDGDDDHLLQTPPRQIRKGGPFERQRTLHDFLSPRQRQQRLDELEDEDAPTPRATSEQPGSSTDDFIEHDEEDSGESSADDDPVPAALETLRSSLGDNDRDVQLARAFAEMACGLLHEFMGVDMDRQLTKIHEKALWRVMTMVETAGHEVSNQLGWVNAQRNGVTAAIRSYTAFTTGHSFFGSGVSPDDDTEDDRDGRFTCEVCGRSTGGLRSVTFSKRCRADAESLRLHSRSTGKKRTLRRRPLSDDEADGGGPSSQRRRQPAVLDSGDEEDSDSDERRKFWVGNDCVQRVMLATLLKHWTCLFADKLQRVSRHAILRARLVQNKKQAVAQEMAARDRFFGFWCRHLRQALGLAKKMGTWTGRSAFGHAPAPASRFTSVGAEAISLRNQFDE